MSFRAGASPLIALTTNPGTTMDHQRRASVQIGAGPINATMSYAAAAKRARRFLRRQEQLEGPGESPYRSASVAGRPSRTRWCPAGRDVPVSQQGVPREGGVSDLTRERPHACRVRRSSAILPSRSARGHCCRGLHSGFAWTEHPTLRMAVVAGRACRTWPREREVRSVGRTGRKSDVRCPGVRRGRFRKGIGVDDGWEPLAGVARSDGPE